MTRLVRDWVLSVDGGGGGDGSVGGGGGVFFRRLLWFSGCLICVFDSCLRGVVAFSAGPEDS